MPSNRKVCSMQKWGEKGRNRQHDIVLLFFMLNLEDNT